MEAIRAYIERIRKIPVLSPKEEKDLVKKAKAGNKKSLWELINSNLKLVINIAKHYSHYGLPLMDLIEEGNIGLIKAIDKFKPSKGYRLSTYASWWIKQAITRALSEQSRTIRIPVYMEEIISKYIKIKDDLTQKLNREPMRDEIAKRMRVSQKKIADIELWMNKKYSLDSPVGGDETTHLSDMITTQENFNTEEEIKEFFKHQDILNLFNSLDERENKILDLRFGISSGKPATLAEVSRKFKISRERVRQIEKRALKKLRTMVKEQGLVEL